MTQPYSPYGLRRACRHLFEGVFTWLPTPGASSAAVWARVQPLLLPARPLRRRRQLFSTPSWVDRTIDRTRAGREKLLPPVAARPHEGQTSSGRCSTVFFRRSSQLLDTILFPPARSCASTSRNSRVRWGLTPDGRWGRRDERKRSHYRCPGPFALDL